MAAAFNRLRDGHKAARGGEANLITLPISNQHFTKAGEVWAKAKREHLFEECVPRFYHPITKA